MSKEAFLGRSGPAREERDPGPAAQEPPPLPGLLPAGLLISEDAIGPDDPPDAKDAFHLLIDGATEYAVFVLSPLGVVSTWNRGAERIMGYQRDEIIGQRFSVFYPDEQRNAGVPDQALRAAAANGRVLAEGWRLRRDGSRFWAHVVIFTLWDASGRLRGFATLTRDQTDKLIAVESSQRLARLSEQERIATALADTMARRLFTIGLHLNGVLRLTDDNVVRQRIEDCIDETDRVITELRRAVFSAYREHGSRP